MRASRPRVHQTFGIGSVDVVGPWRTAMVTRSESESATIVRIA
jgi:hypothetical protein